MGALQGRLGKVRAAVAALRAAHADARGHEVRAGDLRERERASRTQEIESERAEAARALEREVEAALAKVAAQFVSATEAQANTEAALGRELDEVAAATRRKAEAWAARLSWLAVPWGNAAWGTWSPPRALSPPSHVRVGSLTRVVGMETVQLPALVPFAGGPGLLLDPEPRLRAVCNQITISVASRLLLALPPRMCQLVLVDPVGHGENAARFMYLREHDKDLIGGKAWTQTNEIEERLRGVTQHIQEVNEGSLRSQYRNIEHYNAEKPVMPVPYTAVVVFDFPKAFSERAVGLLRSIVQAGTRCGVIPIVVHMRDGHPDRRIDMAPFRAALTTIEDANAGLRFRDPALAGFAFEPDRLPDEPWWRDRVETVGRSVQQAAGVAVRPSGLERPSTGRWSGATTAREVRVAVGPRNQTLQQELVFGGEKAVHGLVVGKTGSGKSTLLHTIVAQLVSTYSPEELQLYLLDFKKVEFHVYAREALPHAAVIAIQSDREFGVSVLRSLIAEMERRQDAFTAAGVQDLTGFRAVADTPMPRIVAILDEFQLLLHERDEVASAASSLLERLVREARSQGIHLLLATQSLLTTSGKPLGDAILGQLSVRMVLQCAMADAKLVLRSDDPSPGMLKRRGEAVFTDSPELLEASQRFQVAFVPDDERRAFLMTIREAAGARGLARTPFVFEGTGVARLERNPTLAAFLARPARSQARGKLHAALGEPMSLEPVVAVGIQKQAGNHLLVVGGGQEHGAATLIAAVLSLAVQLPDDGAEFLVGVFTDPEEPGAAALNGLASALTHPTTSFGRRQLPESVHDVAEHVRNAAAGAEVLQTSSRMFLVLAGVHALRDLELTASAYPPYGDYDGPNRLRADLHEILRSGPEVGVHVLAWCDSARNLDRVLGSVALKEMDERVAFQMSDHDSRQIIEGHGAEALGRDRAIHYSRATGLSQKVRPYQLPEDAYLDRLRAALRKAGTP